MKKTMVPSLKDEGGVRELDQNEISAIVAYLQKFRRKRLLFLE
ncbi:hypothetical protein [Virgibacillus oceani]|uniref:Uncharacterized protein n=1 Tax=Virgibacillus oceani TaxID=1479511 RepID=A0A917HNC4_9BACI|nr:hypothetical protein [Virgibacillus oceani]GGG85228.1 hypothetical protein GCM10011398_33730 [Virgibacillus oceani]